MGPICVPYFNQIWIFSTDFHRTISYFKEIRKGPSLYLKLLSYPNVSTRKFWLKKLATMTKQDSKFSQRCYWRFKSSEMWRPVGWLSYIFWVLRNIGKYVLIGKIFRRIFGPKYEDGEWKSRRNLELEELIKKRKYSKMVKGAKDKLAGSPGENGGG
jgi:hypothetical protein